MKEMNKITIIMIAVVALGILALRASWQLVPVSINSLTLQS